MTGTGHLVNFNRIPAQIRVDLDLPAARGRLSKEVIIEWVESHPDETLKIAKALKLPNSRGKISRASKEVVIEMIASPQARGETRPRDPQLSVIRLWALNNGYIACTRGRIPDEVKLAYHEAHKSIRRRRGKSP